MKSPGSLRRHRRAAAFAAELCGRHLEELEFLLGQREMIQRSSEHLWTDAEPWEDRIFAHVEALRAGGDAALAPIQETLASDDAAVRRAAAMALGALWPSRLSEVGTPELAGLLLSEHPDLVSSVETALEDPEPARRAAAAVLLGARGEGRAGALARLLEDDDGAGQDAAAIALMRLGHRESLPALRRCVLRRPASVALLESALAMGAPEALPLLREWCADPSAPPEALELLALTGAVGDAALMRRPGGLLALGILGDRDAVPWLIDALVAGMAPAADALALISGSSGPVEPERPAEEDGSDEGGAPRPSTDPEAWRGWWREHDPHFSAGQRIRSSLAWSAAELASSLEEPRASFAVRALAGRELQLRTSEAIDYQPEWPVRRLRLAARRWKEQVAQLR